MKFYDYEITHDHGDTLNFTIKSSFTVAVYTNGILTSNHVFDSEKQAKEFISEVSLKVYDK